MRAAHVIWSAPLRDGTGYAEEARNFLFGLQDVGVTVRAEDLRWSRWEAALDRADQARIDDLTSTPNDARYVRVEHITPRALVRDPSALATIGRTMFETDGLPPDFVAACNQLDEIWVPTDFNLETFASAGVDPARLRKLPGALNAQLLRRDLQPLPLPIGNSYVFLSIFDWIPRKGWDVLLRAYVEEFTPEDDVCLLLKTYAADGSASPAELRARLQAYLTGALGHRPDRLPHISLLMTTFDEQHMARLYRNADCYVLASRGEGWGRPLLEAMASGLPTIGTGWSGNTEFMTPHNAFLVEYQLTTIPADVCASAPWFGGQRWAEPSVEHLRALMRQVFTHRDMARARGARARREALGRYSRQAIGRLLAGHLERVLGRDLMPTFGAHVEPLPLDERRRVAFFHHPDWSTSTWEDVVIAYARAFSADDDVTLVLCVDPGQGVAEPEVAERLVQRLAAHGVDTQTMPDLLLVPGEMDHVTLGRLYAAVNVVVPHGDELQVERARRAGKRMLTRLEPRAWRSAA